MHVTDIFTYPVKSMAPLEHGRIEVSRRGLAGDRRWMVTDDNYRFVTGRLLGALAATAAKITDDGALVLGEGQDAVSVPVPGTSATIVEARVWRDTLALRDAGEPAARWLARRFGRPLRLVYQPSDIERLLPLEKAISAGDHVSLADAYPLLAIGTASLADLNRRLESPVTMRHFRPNIVLATDTAFVEDGLRQLSIGAVTFAVASPCSRCIFTTVDPQTGVKSRDGEPLQTLRSYRQGDDGQIYFGVNLVPLTTGVIEQGSLAAATT
ncbi:MAG: MOSC N-terminal beta barrel domain-containing protein [Pseudomonadota bacterium]